MIALSDDSVSWLIGALAEMVCDNLLFMDEYDIRMAIAAAAELGADDSTLTEMQEMYDALDDQGEFEF